MLTSILNCIQLYNGAVTAIATVVLVFITAIYAWLTNRIVAEAKFSRKDNLLPILSVEFTEGKMRIGNIGKGLAQNVTSEPKLLTPFGITLAPNSEWSLDIPNIEKLEIFYEDVFGRRCITRIDLKKGGFIFTPPTNT